MSFSDNIIGRIFTWGGVDFLIVESQGDSVVAVYRDEEDSLVRIRMPMSQALSTIEASEVELCDAPVFEQAG